MSFNKSILLGRITRDPEVTETPTGKTVVRFTLAVDRPFLNPQGIREADFIPVVLWGKAAEMVGNSCVKGHRLLVEGRLQIRQYEDKDKNKKWAAEVVGEKIDFIERRNKDQDMSPEGFTKELAQAEQEAKTAPGIFSDNVPF